MQTLHKRCAGLDVHKKEVVACLRLVARNKASHEVRRFPTTTRGLIELAEWLEAAKGTHVAMEATGVYWKPVWHILEGRFQLVLANAAHIKGVPGRKSDTNDATWIADLLAPSLFALSRRRLDPCELRAAATDPGVARPDSDAQATHPRDRAAYATYPGGAGGSQYQALLGAHGHSRRERTAHP